MLKEEGVEVEEQASDHGTVALIEITECAGS
jgi:hypothetical protein